MTPPDPRGGGFKKTGTELTRAADRIRLWGVVSGWGILLPWLLAEPWRLRELTQR